MKMFTDPFNKSTETPGEQPELTSTKSNTDLSGAKSLEDTFDTTTASRESCKVPQISPPPRGSDIENPKPVAFANLKSGMTPAETPDPGENQWGMTPFDTFKSIGGMDRYDARILIRENQHTESKAQKLLGLMTPGPSHQGPPPGHRARLNKRYLSIAAPNAFTEFKSLAINGYSLFNFIKTVDEISDFDNVIQIEFRFPTLSWTFRKGFALYYWIAFLIIVGTLTTLAILEICDQEEDPTNFIALFWTATVCCMACAYWPVHTEFLVHFLAALLAMIFNISAQVAFIAAMWSGSTSSVQILLIALTVWTGICFVLGVVYSAVFEWVGCYVGYTVVFWVALARGII